MMGHLQFSIKWILTANLILCLLPWSLAQDTTWQRSYDFGVFTNHDLRNSSMNAIGLHRVLHDGFDDLVSDHMNPRAGKWVKGIFSFATTYLTMLWSHEFGHSIRANQVGGHFRIHNFGLPVPHTTAELPAGIRLIDEALFVTAGFEVNYLNIRTLQNQFIRQNGLWNEDLAHSFANRLMYPIYTTFIVPIDPEDRDVWIETAGDPVHYILPVFNNYSDGKVFLPDNSVNPDLVNLYSQATLFAQLINLLDPQFYRELGATFGKDSKVRRPIFLIGDHENGWTYGTLFNASPLGYELYLQNYIHWRGEQYGIYFKYGRPFENLGLGLSWSNVFHYPKFHTDLKLEVWQQDIFGEGLSAEIQGIWKVSKSVGMSYNVGYKMRGYLLGKQLDSGLNIGLGIHITPKP